MLSRFRQLLGFEPEIRVPPIGCLNASDFFAALDGFQSAVFRRMRLRYRQPGADSFCKLVAIKTANALAAAYHFRNRHSGLASRPVHLQMDPTNACHLSCPSCLHTSNTEWASRFEWPSATLRAGEFARFCDQFGPFATGITLFRDGEPLLHRRFPEFAALAKTYLLYTLTCTTLSMPVDAEALVASGLDRLVVAIDGASAATYNRYRRGGDFAQVIENLRVLVAARKAQASRKPWLVWQFLAFEHNVHEVQEAARLAREIGIDQLVVARPHSVEHDDPRIKVAEAAPFGETLFSEPYDWCGGAERASVIRNAERIDRAFNESWADRYAEAAGAQGKPGPDSTCRWLYYNVTMDAARRITPCCLPPMGEPEPRHLVYAHFDGTNATDVVNSADAVLARRECRRGHPRDVESEKKTLPYCIVCADYPEPPMWPDVAAYLRSVDGHGALPPAIHAAVAASPLFAVGPERQ